MLRQFTVPMPRPFAHAVVLATANLVLTLTGCTHRTTVRPAHTVLETGGGRAATAVHGARWANVVLGNVKRGETSV